MNKYGRYELTIDFLFGGTRIVGNYDSLDTCVCVAWSYCESDEVDRGGVMIEDLLEHKYLSLKDAEEQANKIIQRRLLQPYYTISEIQFAVDCVREEYNESIATNELAFSRGLKQGRLFYDDDGYKARKKSRHRAKARRIKL